MTSTLIFSTGFAAEERTTRKRRRRIERE